MRLLSLFYSLFGLTCVLLPVTGSWACPSSAAACMKVGNEYVSLGHVESGPTLDTNVLVLKYTDGQACPRMNGTRTSIIRFKCEKVVSDASWILSLSASSVFLNDCLCLSSSHRSPGLFSSLQLRTVCTLSSG